jgi:hypothetical protein
MVKHGLAIRIFGIPNLLFELEPLNHFTVNRQSPGLLVLGRSRLQPNSVRHQVNLRPFYLQEFSGPAADVVAHDKQ